MPPNPHFPQDPHGAASDTGASIHVGDGAQVGQAAAGSNIQQYLYQAGHGTINIFQGAQPDQPRKWRVALVHYADEAKPANVRVLLQNALATEPLKQNFILLPDGEPVERNDQWNEQMFLWIGLAHIVVLLVSPRALASKWFEQAVEFLSGRALYNDRLITVPVLFDVTPQTFEQTLASKLAPASVWVEAGGDAEGITATIVARLKTLKRGEPDETAMETLARTIAGALQYSSRVALRNAALKLGLKEVEECPKEELRIQVAGALWFANVLGWEDALTALATDPDVKPLVLLNHIKPSWVNILSAIELVPLFQREPPTRAIVLQGNRPEFTGDSYLRRAKYAWKRSRIFVPINPLDGPNPAPIRADEIFDALKRFFGNAGMSNEMLKSSLQKHLTDNPLFIVIAPPETEPDGLAEFLKTFDPPPPHPALGGGKSYSIVFIVLCQDAAHSSLKQHLAKRQCDLAMEDLAEFKYNKLVNDFSE